MKTLHFNTGRKYTVNGQQITATLHDDNVVTFYDHSRMVDGEYRCNVPDFFSQTEVMFEYDHYNAFGTKRSWEDAFQRDGVNSQYHGK